MRTRILLLLLAVTCIANAQTDTLFFANFETDPTTTWPDINIGVAPNGQTQDTAWYSFDGDGLPDGSATGRADEWFWTTPLSSQDSIGNLGVMASNSWTNISTSPVQNWLITQSIDVLDNSFVLKWKSAPFQTPRYLDGYHILVSNTTNDLMAFTDTLFIASEYVSLDLPGMPNDWASYTFSPDPSNGFVHGINGTYIYFDGDSTRFQGMLEPLERSLAPYAGQTIFIAFLHSSTDDNIVSIDDILVEYSTATGLVDPKNSFSYTLFPNPASGNVGLELNLNSPNALSLTIKDLTGKTVVSYPEKLFPAGKTSLTLSLEDLNNGVYFVEISGNNHKEIKKLVITK